MEFAMGFLLGVWAMPWLWLSLLVLLFTVDVVLTESEAFGWATFMLLGGAGLIAWLGADVNVFKWLYHNPAEIIKFLFFYIAAGVFWSILKWYIFLLKIREKVNSGAWNYSHSVTISWDRSDNPNGATAKPRPIESFAKNNKRRLVGWVAHWPFSMIGCLFGDVLTRLFTNIYRVLSGLYEQIANSVFSDFDSGDGS